MSLSAFRSKYNSYIHFLECKINGCPKRWYGRKKDRATMTISEKELPPWREVTIRCHDFRVDFCTRCYYARIPIKTLQSWMGNGSPQMILEIYSKLTKAEKEKDAIRLAEYMEQEYEPKKKKTASFCEHFPAV